jgi:hypothetical protein
MSNILTVHVNPIAKIEKLHQRKLDAYRDAKKRIQKKVKQAWLKTTMQLLEMVDDKMGQEVSISKLVISSKYPENGSITITDSTDKKWRIFWDGSKFTAEEQVLIWKEVK